MNPSKRLPFFFSPILLVMMVIFSCNPPVQDASETHNKQDVKESLTRANKQLTAIENTRIQSFIKRYGWKMQQSGSGLFYHIYLSHAGPKPTTHDTVQLVYSLQLLNGEVLYSAANPDSMVVELGKGKTINGLEEGIFLMGLGDKAKLIVPSHLAFGLLGDQNKIPRKATLVYDVTLTSLNRKSIYH